MHGVDIFQVANINIGLLVILGITAIGVYGIALSGWSSNNKYSLLGSLRATAQVISYELALGLSLVGVVLRARSLNLRDIVDSQTAHGALLEHLRRLPDHRLLHLPDGRLRRDQPLALRSPEAETELVAGYHTEYSSMKFAMFFMAEYANMITVGCVATLLFFGGASSPFGHLFDQLRRRHRLQAQSSPSSGLSPRSSPSCCSISGCAPRCPASATTSSWASAGSSCCPSPWPTSSSPALVLALHG